MSFASLQSSRPRPSKAAALIAVSAGCLLGAVMAADATAATGDLIQKPGAAGCVSAVGDCSLGKALDAPRSVTVSPDGRSAYAASPGSDAVAVCDRVARDCERVRRLR